MIRAKVTALLFAAAATQACTARVATSDGQETYEAITPGARTMTYAFAEGAPEWLGRSLGHALAEWNAALGSERLRSVRAGERPTVVIDYVETARLERHPGKTLLLGCMDGLDRVATCRITLALPAKVEAPEVLADMSFLLRSGALDRRMHASKTYLSVEEFLRDKLAVLVLAHEIGHSIGLGHAADQSCLMAAAPSADAAACAGEVRAAKKKLAVR